MKQFKFKAKTTAIAMIASACTAGPVLANSDGYEIWGADQSNSVSGVASRGVAGSYMWIWDSADMEKQLAGGPAAMPMGCDGKNTKEMGPCDVNEVFPGKLKEYDASGKFTGNRLADLPAFGRLHGMLPDPQNQYMNINMFAPGGGYVGIVRGDTKEAVALFRVTSTNGTGVQRSLHMSFWNSDGSALLLANLHGKVLERIDITRNAKGKITDAVFNQSASLGVGKNMSILDSAKAYRGKNAHGNQMLGRVAGDYDTAAFGDLTPNGECKENGCGTGPDGAMGGRANNVIVCPIVSDNDNAYVTFGGGGLLVADTTATPMTIVGEYDNQVINGAGCGGVQVGDDMWLNAGASASGAGATQSTFTMYTIDDTGFGSSANAPNTPAPTEVFKDSTNTATIGNTAGDPNPNTTGQIPGTTTRRDAHGMARTLSGSHIHNVDRIQNNVEVFDTTTLARTTYDLTSGDGQGGNGLGACASASVTDDAGLPGNDPAPDLMDTTPDGKYLVVALRGPIPVSVTHAAQGSCPGVGIIEVTDGGASGRLAGVLRTTNTVDTSAASAPGGHAYTGNEHSDVHGAAVRRK
jgi:hypothetical protein